MAGYTGNNIQLHDEYEDDMNEDEIEEAIERINIESDKILGEIEKLNKQRKELEQREEELVKEGDNIEEQKKELIKKKEDLQGLKSLYAEMVEEYNAEIENYQHKKEIFYKNIEEHEKSKEAHINKLKEYNDYLEKLSNKLEKYEEYKNRLRRSEILREQKRLQEIESGKKELNEEFEDDILEEFLKKIKNKDTKGIKEYLYFFIKKNISPNIEKFNEQNNEIINKINYVLNTLNNPNFETIYTFIISNLNSNSKLKDKEYTIIDMIISNIHNFDEETDKAINKAIKILLILNNSNFNGIFNDMTIPEEYEDNVYKNFGYDMTDSKFKFIIAHYDENNKLIENSDYLFIINISKTGYVIERTDVNQIDKFDYNNINDFIQDVQTLIN